MGRRRKNTEVLEQGKTEEEAEKKTEERLYRIGLDMYVQYNGQGDVPDLLRRYAEANNGEMPPYIPLPGMPVEFRVGIEFGSDRRVTWQGTGPLPPPVVAFVRENGVLPRHESELAHAACLS